MRIVKHYRVQNDHFVYIERHYHIVAFNGPFNSEPDIGKCPLQIKEGPICKYIEPYCFKCFMYHTNFYARTRSLNNA